MGQRCSMRVYAIFLFFRSAYHGTDIQCSGAFRSVYAFVTSQNFQLQSFDFIENASKHFSYYKDAKMISNQARVMYIKLNQKCSPWYS